MYKLYEAGWEGRDHFNHHMGIMKHLLLLLHIVKLNLKFSELVIQIIPTKED